MNTSRARGAEIPAFAAQTSPLPPPPPGSYPRGNKRTPWLVIGIVLMLLFVLFLGCAGVFAAVFFPTLQQASVTAQRASCANNLQELSVALAMYVGESRDLYPPLPAEPGRLMFSEATLYPEYLTEPMLFVCPSQGMPDSALPENMLDDYSYFYLSHAVLNDEQGKAFADAYRERTKKGLAMDADLPVPDGQGSNGTNQLKRLRKGLENLLAPDPLDKDATSEILVDVPVMVEWPFHHTPQGGHVLYLGGHVEFVQYPGRFPMTPEFIETMQELNRLGAAPDAR